MTTHAAMDNEIKQLVEMLVRAINDLGLAAEPLGANMVWAANRCADSPKLSIPGQAGPGLTQSVACRADDNGDLAWWWIWTARDEDLEYEWLGPADETDVAAVKIARVLALRPEKIR